MFTCTASTIKNLCMTHEYFMIINNIIYKIFLLGVEDLCFPYQFPLLIQGNTLITMFQLFFYLLIVCGNQCWLTVGSQDNLSYLIDVAITYQVLPFPGSVVTVSAMSSVIVSSQFLLIPACILYFFTTCFCITVLLITLYSLSILSMY